MCGSKNRFQAEWPVLNNVSSFGFELYPRRFSLNSIELVVWVALGGRATLYGAALGAGLVNYIKTVLTGALPEVWLFVLGALFVIVTVALPRGVIGIWRQLRLRGSHG